MASPGSPAPSEVSALTHGSRPVAGRASIVSAASEYPSPSMTGGAPRQPVWPAERAIRYADHRIEAGPRSRSARSARPQLSRAPHITLTAPSVETRTNRQTVRPSTNMFNLSGNPKVMGSGLLVLNALRALTLATLGIVMASSWIMIAFSAINGHFQFFDSATHFFVFVVSVILALSELNIKFLRSWFIMNWPGLSPGHSLIWLGVVLIVIGCQIMGDLVKPAYTIETIGLTFWRLILAAGILAITFGFFNIFASLIYRSPQNGIYARDIRSKGSLAEPAFNSKTFYDGYAGTDYSSSHRDNFSQRGYPKEEEVEESSAVRRLTRVFNPKNFRKSRIQISKPIPQEVDLDCERGMDRASPILPEVQRPPTALHPALTGGSRYSEAHMDRF